MSADQPGPSCRRKTAHWFARLGIVRIAASNQDAGAAIVGGQCHIDFGFVDQRNPLRGCRIAASAVSRCRTGREDFYQLKPTCLPRFGQFGFAECCGILLDKPVNNRDIFGGLFLVGAAD